MRYIIIVTLALSLPAMALAPNTSEYKNEKSQINVLQKRIHEQIKKEGICDPGRELRVPSFN